jgi:hypothetical protein
VNFYCSVEHLDPWLATTRRAGRRLSLHEAVAAGPALWGAMR